MSAFFRLLFSWRSALLTQLWGYDFILLNPPGIEALEGFSC